MSRFRTACAGALRCAALAGIGARGAGVRPSLPRRGWSCTPRARAWSPGPSAVARRPRPIWPASRSRWPRAGRPTGAMPGDAGRAAGLRLGRLHQRRCRQCPLSRAARGCTSRAPRPRLQGRGDLSASRSCRRMRASRSGLEARRELRHLPRDLHSRRGEVVADAAALAAAGQAASRSRRGARARAHARRQGGARATRSVSATKAVLDGERPHLTIEARFPPGSRGGDRLHRGARQHLRPPAQAPLRRQRRRRSASRSTSPAATTHASSRARRSPSPSSATPAPPKPPGPCRSVIPLPSSPPSEAQSGNPAQISTARVCRWIPACALRACGNASGSTNRLAGQSLEGLEREGAGRTCLARVVRGQSGTCAQHRLEAPANGSGE